jgi:hypothetical protein
LTCFSLCAGAATNRCNRKDGAETRQINFQSMGLPVSASAAISTVLHTIRRVNSAFWGVFFAVLFGEMPQEPDPSTVSGLGLAGISPALPGG